MMLGEKYQYRAQGARIHQQGAQDRQQGAKPKLQFPHLQIYTLTTVYVLCAFSRVRRTATLLAE